MIDDKTLVAFFLPPSPARPDLDLARLVGAQSFAAALGVINRELCHLAVLSASIDAVVDVRDQLVSGELE